MVDKKFVFDATFVSDTISKMRVTILSNATLVCFGISHYLSDGTACFDIVKAFCNLLSKKSIPSFVLPPDARGIRLSDTVIGNKDIQGSEVSTREYRALVEDSGESDPCKNRCLLRRIMLKISPGKPRFGEGLTTRFIHIPGLWLQKIRAKTEDELLEYPQASGIVLTRNDILAAWYLKTVVYPEKSTDDPVDFCGPINYRPFVRNNDAGTYYIHNSISWLRWRSSVRQLQSCSITRIALEIRLATMKYQRPASVKQFLQFSESLASNTLPMNARGNRNVAVVALSPWTTFDYKSLDFSGANVGSRKVSVTFVDPVVSIPLNAAVGPVAITQKDGLGGYWIRASNTAAGWENLCMSSNLKNLFPG